MLSAPFQMKKNDNISYVLYENICLDDYWKLKIIQ